MTRTTKLFILGGAGVSIYMGVFPVLKDGMYCDYDALRSVLEQFWWPTLVMAILLLLYGIYYYHKDKKSLLLFVVTWVILFGIYIFASPLYLRCFDMVEQVGTPDPPLFIVPVQQSVGSTSTSTRQ